MPPVTEPHICLSKNCVHKAASKSGKDDKKNKKKRRHLKKKVESESESSDSDSSSSSEESSVAEEEASDDESSSSSSSSSEEEVKPRKSKKSKPKANEAKKVKIEIVQPPKASKSKNKKVAPPISEIPEEVAGSDSQTSSPEDSEVDELESLRKELELKGLLKRSAKGGKLLKTILKQASKKDSVEEVKPAKSESGSKVSKTKSDKKDKKVKEKEALKGKYKRLDEIWDETVRDYRLKETSDKKDEDQWEKYVFTVRRKFNVQGVFQQTVVEIKSAFLKDCLKVVMDGVEGVSLVEKTPRLLPDMLFLHLEDFRDYVETLKEARRGCDDKKVKKSLRIKAQHLTSLIKYLDKDYDEIKKTLYPMLDNGTITFDFLWALYKPNTLAYSTTYGDEKQPRAFRVDLAFKERHCMKGPYYSIEGRYLDYDGENFGWAFLDCDIYQFQGARKITSLPCYPLHHHQNEEALRLNLIERGKKFLTLTGMKYKSCQGTSYMKKDNNVLKININGRVMVDPKTFRRINPNYPLSDMGSRDVEDKDEECLCEQEDTPPRTQKAKETLFMLNEKEDKEVELLELDPTDPRAPDNITEGGKRTEAAKKTFVEEELLLASPLLPGFSFSEKSWVELPVSAISEVQWNEGAFDSLVIPEQHKSIVKALVTAHGQHASQSIDDVVSGKGRGLVAVLHGKPGLGKTLTCEAISDLLKRPLYSVTAGDLGTHATNLEYQLQVILDVAHAWGAVLLLDEADVFLEKRSTHDVHRNAMVSVFLRMLEYFSGVLMMTTNRVETFDDAFVSRIHLSLRYGELTVPARKAIWKTFITKVAESAAASSASTTGSDSSSMGVETPGTTASTPNSGAATPAIDHSLVYLPSTPGTPMLCGSTNSLDSTASCKTVTPSAPQDPTTTPAAEPVAVSSSTGVEKITETNYLELARVDLNGRQIKNLVKTAQALALYEGVSMGMTHLRRCIEVGRSFEMDLKGGRGWEDAMRSYT